MSIVKSKLRHLQVGILKLYFIIAILHANLHIILEDFSKKKSLMFVKTFKRDLFHKKNAFNV